MMMDRKAKGGLETADKTAEEEEEEDPIHAYARENHTFAEGAFSFKTF